MVRDGWMIARGADSGACFLSCQFMGHTHSPPHMPPSPPTHPTPPPSLLPRLWVGSSLPPPAFPVKLTSPASAPSTSAKHHVQRATVGFASWDLPRYRIISEPGFNNCGFPPFRAIPFRYNSAISLTRRCQTKPRARAFPSPALVSLLIGPLREGGEVCACSSAYRATTVSSSHAQFRRYPIFRSYVSTPSSGQAALIARL